MSSDRRLYLIRFSEAGREPQAKRGRLRQDIVGVLRARIPDAEVRTDIGRIFLVTATEVTEVIGDVHGVASFSPCRQCSLAELDEAAVELASKALAGKRTFRVKVKRTGDHSFSSMEMAAHLGERIGEHMPSLRVDFAAPEVVIGVEIRRDDCYLFDEMIPGVDRRAGLREPSGSEPRFLVDQMLGKLVAWLRLLGFDTTYVCDQADTVLLRQCREENRILVTRDLELSWSQAVDICYLESETPKDQLEELIDGLGLTISRGKMFTRCTICNQKVEAVDKERVKDRLPEVAYQQYDEFTHCRACDKLYWKGGQYERILARLSPVTKD